MSEFERRFMREPSYSARMGAARTKVVGLAADFFERSGVRYDCLKTVQDTVKPELDRLATLEEFRPYNVNSTNQLRRVGDEVHRRWKQKPSVRCPGCGITVLKSSDAETDLCTSCQRNRA